jgi:ribosomal protein L37E
MKIKCEACGTEWENATGAFCDNCGYRMIRIKPQKVGENPELIRCRKCGASYAWGTKICGNCGDLLRYD